MPKAYLSFKLPEEQEEFDLALNGANYKYQLDEMDSYLRNILKYTEVMSDDARITYQGCRDKLRWIMNSDLY